MPAKVETRLDIEFRQCYDGHKQPGDPRFDHDCDSCYYLGRYEGGIARGEYDLWICLDCISGPSPIARFGSEDCEYGSGMVFATKGLEPYATARQRAIELGLYDPEGPDAHYSESKKG